MQSENKEENTLLITIAALIVILLFGIVFLSEEPSNNSHIPVGEVSDVRYVTGHPGYWKVRYSGGDHNDTIKVPDFSGEWRGIEHIYPGDIIHVNGKTGKVTKVEHTPGIQSKTIETGNISVTIRSDE